MRGGLVALLIACTAACTSGAPGAATLQTLFEDGYDVVSSQSAQNDVQTRIVVNKSRGVTPL